MSRFPNLVMLKSSKFQILLRELTGLVDVDQSRVKSAQNPIPEGFNPNDICPCPFRDLPNISSLRLRTGKHDPLLASHGILKKLTPEMETKCLSRRIKAANRYIHIMHRRLAILLYQKRTHEFWVLALLLMRRSNVIRAVALRKVNLNWHRQWKYGYVRVLLSQLNLMIETLPVRLSFRRKYEPKGQPLDGVQKWRPVGVPRLAERMFLFIWQSFFVMFTYQYISKSQHAYFPGRGCLTALREVKESLAKYQFVWEFDLKGAFPSLIIPKTLAALESFGVPECICWYFERMSILTVEEVDMKDARDRGLRSGTGPIREDKFVRQHNIRSGPLPRLAELGLEMELAACRSRKTEHIPIEFRGFPQGSGTSPIFFNFAFEHFALRDHFSKLHPSVKVISYADDFLVFSDVDLNDRIWELPDNGSGLVINLEKSRQIRSDGKDLVKSFKYLGVTFVLPENLIIGTPRSGLNLTFSKDAMIEDFSFRDKQLRRFANAFKAQGAPLSPSLIMDQWSRDEQPSSLLPLEVLQGKAPLTKALITHISTALSSSSLVEQSSSVTQGNQTASASLEERIKSAPSWLKTRLSGLLLNRLHSGSWNPSVESASRTLSSPPKTEGRSWLELRSNSASPQVQLKWQERIKSQLSHFKLHHKDATSTYHAEMLSDILSSIRSWRDSLSIYNSTSHATVDILNHLKDEKSVKIAKSGIVYR